MTKGKATAVCELCGEPADSDPFTPKWPGPKHWCTKCMEKGLYWGMERYTDAVKP